MLVTFLQILKPIKVLSNDESSFDHKDATRVDQLHQARDQKDHVASISISPQTSCFHFLLYVVSLSFCCFSVSFFLFLFVSCFLFLRLQLLRNWRSAAHGARHHATNRRRRSDMKLGICIGMFFLIVVIFSTNKH